MTKQKIKIGTRESPLAIAQAEEVKRKLMNAYGFSDEQVELCGMTTEGDQILDRSFVDVGGKMLFTREIEKALMDKKVDLAVHSFKDLETDMAEDFIIGAVLEREDPRDAFVSIHYKSFMDLPHGAKLGSASLRRKAFALRLRPDLEVVLLRGNVGTRYRKLQEGQFDGTFMATAGLNRLGKSDFITEKMEVDRMIPAPAQGAIAVQIRSGDEEMQRLVSAIHCHKTGTCVDLERLFLFHLDGSCRTPIAAHAYFESDHQIHFRAKVLKPDGSNAFDFETKGGSVQLAHEIIEAALRIKVEAGPDFFKTEG